MAKITPTGRVVLENGDQYRNGLHKITPYDFVRIEPLTDERREEITRAKLVDRIGNHMYRIGREKESWSRVSTDDLKTIARILAATREGE